MGKQLGRHVRPKAVRWHLLDGSKLPQPPARLGPVLDQGSLGSSTGFAAATLLGTERNRSSVDAGPLYERATALDEFPEDTHG